VGFAIGPREVPGKGKTCVKRRNNNNKSHNNVRIQGLVKLWNVYRIFSLIFLSYLRSFFSSFFQITPILPMRFCHFLYLLAYDALLLTTQTQCCKPNNATGNTICRVRNYFYFVF
jgi:hypothetical protein